MEVTDEEMLRKFNSIEKTPDIDLSDLTPVQEFYNNTTLFITGATGFLGTVLLEKLLVSCPISKIYLLIRHKKGSNTEQRLNDFLTDDIFQRLNKVNPDWKEKVAAIEGDCLNPNLGLSFQDRQLLINEVNIIFHVAATVRFDEKLKRAVFINVRATRDLMKMAQEMPHLKSFVHISTAYSNCVNRTIHEIVYPPALNYKAIISLAEAFPNSTVEKITPILVGNYPNTYVYTKQIGEDVVKQEGQGLPIGIHRPSIVVSTYREPVRGWINNVYGAMGYVVGSGVGLIHVGHINPHCNANMVPADMCINSVIATGWEIGKTFQEEKANSLNNQVPVYFYESRTDKPITWNYFERTAKKYGVRFPSAQAIWHCFLVAEHNYFIYLVLRFLIHTLPALLIDMVLFLMGKERRMVATYRKIHKFSGVMSYYAIQEWNMKSENVKKVIDKMSERDRSIFFCDMGKLDWDDFFQCFSLGCLKYLLKETTDNQQLAKNKARRLYWLHVATIAILVSLTLWTLWSLFKPV